MKLFLIDNEEIESDAVMSTLRKTGYIKNIVKELILEKILSDQEVNPLEAKKILDNYKIEQNLDTEEKYISFLEEKLINEELLIEMLLRPTKIIRYREERWGQRANSLYLKYKDDYDLVTQYITIY